MPNPSRLRRVGGQDGPPAHRRTRRLAAPNPPGGRRGPRQPGAPGGAGRAGPGEGPQGDPDEHVRQAAANALNSISSPEATRAATVPPREGIRNERRAAGFIPAVARRIPLRREAVVVPMATVLRTAPGGPPDFSKA